MSRSVFRIFVKLTLVLVLVALAGLAAFYLAGPAVLERVIVKQMRSAGLVEPDIRVRAITHTSVHLTHVTVQQPRLHIDSISVGFSFPGLLQGRVDDVFISGLKYFIVFKDNKPDLGLPPSRSNTEAAPLVLPFGTINLSSSSLVINYQEKDYFVPFSSQISIENERELIFSVWPHFLGQPFSVEGIINMETLETKIQAKALWSEFLGPGGAFQGWEKASVNSSDPFDARLSLEWAMDAQGRGHGEIDLNVFADGLNLKGPGFTAGIEKGMFALNALFDHSLYFDRLDISLSLSGLSVNENHLENLDLLLKEKGSMLEFSVSMAHPVKASFDAAGRQSSVNDLLGDAADYSGKFEWSAMIEIGPDQLDFFNPVELVIDRPVKAIADGQFEAGFSRDSSLQGQSWFLQMTGARAKSDALSFNIPGYGLRISHMSLETPFSLRWDPHGTVVKLLEKSRLNINELSLDQNSEKVFVRGLAFNNQPGSNFAVLEAEREGPRSILWTAELSRALEVDLPGAHIKVDGLKLDVNLRLDNEGREQAEIRVRPEIGLIRLQEAGAELTDIKLDIPFVLGDVRAKPGSFSTGKISYSGTVLPGMTGTVMIDNYRLESRGMWPVLPGAELEFSLDMTVDPSQSLTGRINAQTDWFNLPEKEVIHGLAPQLDGMTITGAVRAELDMDLKGPLLKPLIQIDIREVDVVYPDMDMEVSGISGSVLIDAFSPLTTPGNQRIDISRLRIGQVELERGFLTFRLESPESFFLEKTRWNLPEGGFIAAHASRFDVQDFSADFEIFFEDIDLIKLVSRLSDEKIAGSGLVYGRVPILYNQDRVRIGQGYLYSVPGAGRLGIRDEDWLEVLLLYVREAMRDHPYLSLVSQRMEEALRDFEYNFLEVKLIPGLEDTAARIELRGRGVEGDPPQEVGSLVINVNDLGEIVNRILRFQLTKDESIERALEDLFGF
jgi:hypothetical protein